MKAYEDEKMKKWERKHPKPCPDDDLFKDEMIPAWEAEKEQALIRIRDFVVSMFDKLPLTGRFKMSEKNAVYQEKKIADCLTRAGDILESLESKSVSAQVLDGKLTVTQQ